MKRSCISGGILVVLALLSSLFPETPKTVAVLDFTNSSLIKSEEYGTLAKGLAEMMITELSQVQAIEVVERQKLQSILSEMTMAQTGLVSEQTGVQVGKMVGAHYLVLGGYMVSFGDKIRIDVRIVHVETGKTIKAEQVTGKTKDVLDLLSQLSKKILVDLEIRLNDDDQKALGKSAKVPLEAMLAFSQGVHFEDVGDKENARKMYTKALQIDKNFTQAKENLKRLSEESGRR